MMNDMMDTAIDDDLEEETEEEVDKVGMWSVVRKTVCFDGICKYFCFAATEKSLCTDLQRVICNIACKQMSGMLKAMLVWLAKQCHFCMRVVLSAGSDGDCRGDLGAIGWICCAATETERQDHTGSRGCSRGRRSVASPT